MLTYSSLKVKAAYGVFVACLLLLAFVIPRESFYMLLSVYGVSFLCFLYLYKITTKNLFALGAVARLLVLFAMPSLSDDYFRFLWDGTLVSSGLSPFLYLPSEVLGYLANINDEVFVNELHDNMNSRPYFSVYPPINQWVFWLAASFPSITWGVVVLKLAVFAADLGLFMVLKKLCHRFSIQRSKIALYWLNPLIIIEMCGNGHMDNMMVMFFLFSTLSFAKLKEGEGSVYYAFAALSKLFSLMFFPLLLAKLSMKRALKVLIVTIVIIVVCYLPFIDLEGLQNMGSSFDLYFQRFEFNGSLYYLARSVGTAIVGYNPIAIVGPVLAIISTSLILLVSYLYRFRNRLAMYTGFLLINTLYLVFSPIVHPWYLAMLVALSVLTKYRFAIAWSGLIFLSYWAYGNNNFEENYWLLLIEYMTVFVFLYLDIKKHFTFNKLKAGLG